MSPMQQKQENVFARLYEAGYKDLVSIIPPDATVKPDLKSYKYVMAQRGKAPGFMTEEGWVPYSFRKYTVDPEYHFAKWAAEGSGVGLRLHAGLFAVDGDCLNAELSKQIWTLALKYLGPSPTRVGRAPKFALLYRLTDEDRPLAKYTNLNFEAGTEKRAAVEIIVDGQLVLHGLYPTAPGETPFYYQITKAVPLPAFDGLTRVTWEQVTTFLEACREVLPEASFTRTGSAALVDRSDVDQDSLTCDEDSLEELGARLPNPATYGYHDMIRIAAAFRAAGRDHADDGLGPFLEWCSRWEGGAADLDQCEREFRSLDAPFAHGAEMIAKTAGAAEGKATAATPSMMGLGEIAFSDEERAFVEQAGAIGRPAVEGDEDYEIGGTKAPRAPIVFKSFAEMASQADANVTPPLVDELLDQGAMSVLYGASNAGKTFVTVFLAYCIATGRLFGGCETAQRRVAYVAAEGGRAFANRIKALQLKHGDAPDFHALDQGVDLFDPEADLRPLIAAILALGGVGLLVLDTLARVMAGGDENTSQDMGVLVRHIDMIRHATGCHVLIVHHSGKDASKGARGSSALRAATDTEIEVTAAEEEGGMGLIEATKQRDLAMSFKRRFRLVGIEVGHDERGKVRTSAVCELEERVAVKPVPADVRAATEGEREVIEAVRAMLGAAKIHGRDGVQLASIVAHLNGSVTPAMVRKHLANATEKGLISKLAKGLYAPGSMSLLTPIEDTKIVDTVSEDELFG